MRPTLDTVAREAFEARKAQLKGDGKAGRWFSPLELHVLPKLGQMPVEDLDQNDIKAALRRSGTRRARPHERRSRG